MPAPMIPLQPIHFAGFPAADKKPSFPASTPVRRRRLDADGIAYRRVI